LGEALPGLIAGPQEMIRRSLLGYVRQQEESADRAAVTFLNATGQSAKGMLETFARFADQTMFVSRSVDPYTLSHPMPRQRIAALEEVAKASPHFNRADPPQLQHRHDMMRAKISGFIDRPEVVARRYPASNNNMPARYARAISGFRFGNINAAIAQIDTLIAEQPNNAYFHELKGQAFLESGRAREAVADYLYDQPASRRWLRPGRLDAEESSGCGTGRSAGSMSSSNVLGFLRLFCFAVVARVSFAGSIDFRYVTRRQIASGGRVPPQAGIPRGRP
jgi:predicted Zn-dependent protease